MTATGRLEVRRALAVLKLLLSMAICAAREMLEGEAACSLGGLVLTSFDIWNNFSIWPERNRRMPSWTFWLMGMSGSWLGANASLSNVNASNQIAMGSESSCIFLAGGVDASTQHSSTEWYVRRTSDSRRKLI